MNNNVSSSILLLSFDGKWKYLAGEYWSESEFLRIIFINFKMKCLKKADVLQPDGDYQIEKVLVRHLFLKLIHLSKQ